MDTEIGTTFYFLKNPEIFANRILVKIRTLKGLLVRTQMQMRSMLLITGWKNNLVIKWQRPCQNYENLSVGWEIKLAREERGYFTEKNSKKRVECSLDSPCCL